MKRNLDLEDFTFSRSDVEQLFLDLARQQKEGDSVYSAPSDTDGGLASPSHNSTGSTGPENHAAPDTRVDDAPDLDPNPSSPARDAEDEGGASCQDAVSDADAAVGLVIVHHSGDDNGGAVAGVEEGGATDVGAAAPVVFRLSLEGEDNPAYLPDEEDRREPQTTL